MTDQLRDHDDVSDPAGAPTPNAVVDQVVADVDGLGDRPLEEHVGVFESAHGRLRGALDVSDAPA